MGEFSANEMGLQSARDGTHAGVGSELLWEEYERGRNGIRNSIDFGFCGESNASQADLKGWLSS